MPINLSEEAGHMGGKRMRAIIHLDGVPDHIEPYDYVYCVMLARKLDPDGKRLKVVVT